MELNGVPFTEPCACTHLLGQHNTTSSDVSCNMVDCGCQQFTYPDGQIPLLTLPDRLQGIDNDFARSLADQVTASLRVPPAIINDKGVEWAEVLPQVDARPAGYVLPTGWVKWDNWRFDASKVSSICVDKTNNGRFRLRLYVEGSPDRGLTYATEQAADEQADRILRDVSSAMMDLRRELR